jgi:hypothetical protein
MYRQQSAQLLPALEKQISILEEKDSLTNKENEQLEILKLSWELTIARLDFVLK